MELLSSSSRGFMDELLEVFLFIPVCDLVQRFSVTTYEPEVWSGEKGSKSKPTLFLVLPFKSMLPKVTCAAQANASKFQCKGRSFLK